MSLDDEMNDQATIRRDVAKAAMQGLLAGRLILAGAPHASRDHWRSEIVREAVALADELLTVLGEKNGQAKAKQEIP